jgi:polyhydroxybutyrate depolymerase
MKYACAILFAAACGKSAAMPDALPVMLGGDRPVKLQVPTVIEEGKTYPLVLILHGYGANGYVQQAYLQMHDLPTEENAFVMAPDGLVDSTGHSYWNADPACCDLDHTGNDDVAYLGGLLDTVIAERPIDRARVFVVGHSNGAFMAYRMACDRSDVVTAIAGLAGLAASTASTCNPSHPVAILHIHGTADTEVPYNGGPVSNTVTAPGAVASVAQWAQHDGCTGALVAGDTIDLESSLPGAETQVSSTAGCASPAAADLWTINGGSHLPNLQPDFHTRVWTWLDAHARP